MLPLLIVYISEYTINQALHPLLLFRLSETPLPDYRSFYPLYATIYQTGVFISRSSTPFCRIHNLYIPSFLQAANLCLLLTHAMFNFLPNIWFVILVVFWEGLLGGAVYVNTFAEVLDNTEQGEREFSMAAVSVSDSGGICVAGFIGLWLEGAVCSYQVSHGRDFCTRS